MDAIYVTGKEVCEMRGETTEGRIRGMRSEAVRIWSLKIGCATSSINTQVSPSDDFTDIFNTTHPNSEIDSL